MAQDVFGEMAEDPWLLNEEGNLKVDSDVKEIIYHPSLNVILICTNFGTVRVLDVNSGVILQSTNLSAQNGNEIICKYIPIEDRVLICDGEAIGVRTDYNGVLLLDSILQKELSDFKENVKIELLLSEAIILKQSLASTPIINADQIVNELQNVVKAVQLLNKDKKGIKAQKWNTACITLPIGDLKQAISSIVSDFISKKIHTPVLQVASAVMERITELMGEQTNANDRRMMASEVRRRETFSQWPHMDYKWALPEQMAQAGFYHQPNSAGDDRAMCFTCTVCLVSWERTDEPWSEHERHSPTCPFVVGEYTQNVPISVSKATGPAIDATFRGINIELLGTSSISKLLPTCTNDGLISVFDVSGKIKRTHSFFVTHFDSHILEKLTQDFGLPGFWNDEKKCSVDKNVTALAIVTDKASKEKAVTKSVRPTIVCGLTISQGMDKTVQDNNDIEPTSKPSDIFGFLKNSRTDLGSDLNNTKGLYLVVYDFMFNKEQEESEDKSNNGKKSEVDFDNQFTNSPLVFDHISMIDITSSDLGSKDEYSLLKELTSFYKTLIPGESDAVFLPPVSHVDSTPKKSHTGPRLLTVDINDTEDDFTAPSDILGFLPNMPNGPFLPDANETSISDHIVDMKNNQSHKKLNYSRTVQCISLPDQCKSCPDLQVTSILTTQDGGHILVTVCSTTSMRSFLLVYGLDFASKMVKIIEEFVIVRELLPVEKPLEIGLLPSLDKFKIPFAKAANEIEGNAVLVCADGAVRILDLSTLRTVCLAKIDGKKFVSAVYCNSLDRLCASTTEGSFHFFALNDSDSESVEEHEEDDLFGLNVDHSVRDLSSMDKLETIRCFREPPNLVNPLDMKTFQKLTLFSPVRSGYNVTVPPCWSEFQQAMRQRRNTSIINTESSTKTWRLQTDTTTWEEHIFEIALPAAVHLGHVDVHFTLQSGCTKPCVEVSLLRQSKSGIGHGKDVKFSVDDTVTIDMLRRVENPVVSEEYLRAHNADILAGPVNIAQYLDLTDQSGIITLTSPRLFKVKVRNLLLHIRAVYDKNEKRHRDAKGNLIVIDKLGFPSRKSEQYLGCDCIHELSIALYSPSVNPQVTHERTIRNLMLDSNVFVQSLITTIVMSNNQEFHKSALDILNWIAVIRLVPNRGTNADAPNDQLEFVFINGIEENMTGLLRQCLLLGSRCTAHKCMLYLLTCCRGATNISKSFGEHFNGIILNCLLAAMGEIKQVKSALALQWIFALLLNVVKPENDQPVIEKCISLLKEISEDLVKRSNPYHLLLRSRYGLYGLPTEPELFDIEPPAFVKGSSTSSPYKFSATSSPNAVPTEGSSGIIIEPDFPSDMPQKDVVTCCPRETSTENKLKYKNVVYPKLINGLIETEPLHFTCINTSEGTRIEMADSLSSNMQTTINNIFPVVLASNHPPPKQTQKEDFQHFIQKYMDKSQCFATQLNDIIDNKMSVSQMIEHAELALDPSKGFSHKNLHAINAYEDLLALKSSNTQGSQHASSSVPNQAPTGSAQGATAPPNGNLPWQQLLVPPPKQVIVVERMHSGAKRHVVLDFGDCISLTDIIIPACSDLVSLTIDVWLFGEEVDAVRLVNSSDIGTKNLFLIDLQPPPHCRYMKITLVGRYGMSTTRCRIPLGYFYGHVIVLPEEVPGEVFIKPTNYEKQLGILSKLLEDISCRYSLVCSKLKDYLQPFLIADMKNTLHLSTYINILKDKRLNISNAEYDKIFTAYQETLTYQHQLNAVRNVMSRIEEGIGQTAPGGASPTVGANESTDKLNLIAEGLLEVLLSVDGFADLSQDLCQHFFKGLCVSQSSRLQLLGAMFLEKSCGSSPFWGNFLADTLVELFSTSCTSIFPQDRLFVLLIYLSRKSPEKSAVIDAAMKAVYTTLKPIETNRSLLLAVNVDLSLLSWLLMYLSLQLTFGKGENDRWEWVLGEMVGTVNVKPSSASSAEAQYKSKPVGSWQKVPHSHCWSTQPKDFKPAKGNVFKKSSGVVDANQIAEEQRDPTSLKDLMMVPQKMPQHVDSTHCLAVSRLLIKFINSMDHSASADMMLLSFKIISKLVTMAKLQLCQLLTETQLLDLIQLIFACKVPWAPFALLCFLQDALEVQSESEAEAMEVDPLDAIPTSSAWSPLPNDIANGDTDSSDNSVVFMHLEESDSAKPKPKAMNNLSFPPLPSVYETDSNDSDIEEVLETFEKVRCPSQKPTKAPASTPPTTSTTIDARLEIGVNSASEVTLRRLMTKNTQKLLQNVSEERVKEVENPLPAWPDPIGPFLPESNQSNLKMLSHCFNELFKSIQTMDPNKIENVLHIWLTLNCTKKGAEKFDYAAAPRVRIKVEAVTALVSALAWTPGLSLTTWCLGLQVLTLVCNTTSDGVNWFYLSALPNAIVNHRNFVQMFVSLLSGSGLAFAEKGIAGPTLCKALHDFLVRLQIRCDIVSQSSKLGNILKTLLLNVIYQLARPGGPISTQMGPLDAQCKLFQSILYLDFTNVDISIGISTFESTALLLNQYFMNIDNIKCVTIGEKQCMFSSQFGDIFASVLGADSNKQDRPVSYEDLLINLLKLLGKLVHTPIAYNSNSLGRITILSEPSASSQTDESKAEQIHQIQTDNSPSHTTKLFFADTVLQHHTTVITLCKCLAACKSSSLCMLTNISQKSFVHFADPSTVGDAVFHMLSSLAKKAARKELVIEPLLMFLSQRPQLSEPFIWFVLQVLDSDEAIKCFYNAGGIQILASSIVSSSNTPSTISRNGTISTMMQHFNGVTNHNDAHVHIAPASANKMFQASVENSSLINFAPSCTITCQSVTSQPPDVLTQGIPGLPHRRARTPPWSHSYFQEETHTGLLLQLPNAVLLKEVQLQPHAGSLATCPSFVAIETSASGPSGLVPACHPLPTSGLTYIRLHLPTAKVVNCVLIRLYKPKVGNSIGLLQIRLLGTYAFGRTANSSSMDSDDDVYCNHSLGWLRLLHHCFTISIDSELRRQLVESASLVPNLLSTCCGLLLVPSHILPVYLPCLEKVLRELSLLTPENGIATIKILLDNRLSIVEPMMSLDNMWQYRLMINVSGYQSACELLYQICEHQDSNTGFRVRMILNWLKATAEECLQTGNTGKCSAAYVSCIASILWFSKEARIAYDLKALISLDFFETIYQLKMRTTNNSLKYALDSLLCSLCYNRSELFPLLLQKIGVLVPNLSTDRAASISDDRKDPEGMTDDRKRDYANCEWYGHLIIGDLSELNLSKEQLETVALASRSPTAIQQLLDSGLPKLLNGAIYEFCHNNDQNSLVPMAKLEKVTTILQFFTDVCDEKMLRDWLGSADGSSFWPHLLHWLCKKPFSSSSVQSEAHVHLEEVCVKFLAKCCLCHPTNQARLATVLCEVISLQQNGISGFLRRLILQLLLENEKVPVSVEADDTLYSTSRVVQVSVPAHPAFKQTYNRTMLYLSITTTLGDIFEHHLSFNATYKSDTAANKRSSAITKKDVINFKEFYVPDFGDLSVAAGNTAKDKRAKDIKNLAASTPQSKKKRYTSEASAPSDMMEGRLIKCLALPEEPLPLGLNLGQLLRLMEMKNSTSNWPYIYLTLYQSKSDEDKNQSKEAIQMVQQQQPICSALQVFSSMGGLALLSQNLPTIYPDTIRVSDHEKSLNDQFDSEWIKLEDTDDIYEDIEEAVGNTAPPKTSGVISHIPPHSLTAFSLFLRLPGYAEVLLKDTKRALCLLRLMLGVTDDGEGGDILQSSVASSLPTLPFEILQKLYDTSPLCSDDGRFLRRVSITTGVVQLLLACLAILTHHSSGNSDKDAAKDQKAKEERQLYWAKGTGFGTGSTQQSWNVEQALMKQKTEEEHVTVLLQVLASYINPNDGAGEELGGNVLPPQFSESLAKSSLLPAICSYLRNDSVLDMARHIPLYKGVFKILRALALSKQLVKLLLPQKSSSNELSISLLLKSMKTCVDIYANKLKVQTPKTDKNGKGSKSSFAEKIEEEQEEGLATLMPDIQNTASLVANVTFGMVDERDSDRDRYLDRLVVISPEEQYIRTMKSLQFASHEMIEEQADGKIKFIVSHHFETMATATPEQSHPARVKRIAQETVTLSTSLPLSYSSSVFVRYDSSRLDVMKVLITGPADTPYANGCFELDVFFPPDYPLSPMLINLETTGHHTVRFNPNLYNDGKVCLSVLNTWHGRPEEKWNSQTSSFLQVLVSIQSLILVPEPYFNEPGYERARGTPAGTANSKDYNHNICQATVRWAMLDQILNPCPCFKDVINAHFYMKKHEVLAQVEKWIQELEVDTKKEKKSGTRVTKKNRSTSLESFKKIYKQLQEQLAKLKPPGNEYEEMSTDVALNEEDYEESPTTPTNSMEVTIDHEQTNDLDTDHDMEKMVNDMCK